ncbi:MAG: hypothetical protein FD146_1073 [Anaerolineaceae bacterium]|nr:MAG: hypothetical protein FD146_1073 [Anaerolineaceae bacterium]
MSANDLWTTTHGMVFGFIFLLGFAGALVGVYMMKAEWLTTEGTNANVNRLRVFLWLLAAAVWAAVFTGTYIVYPWYRAAPPEGLTDLANFPRYLLLANESTAFWHSFGMEWKEHVAFISPMAATVVAFVVQYYGAALTRKPEIRRWVMIFFTVAFFAAAVAGIFGAFITKAAPIR